MKTIYKCEICGAEKENIVEAQLCEDNCDSLAKLDKALTGDDWNPPMLISDFKKWNIGDRLMMLKRIKYFIEFLNKE